MGITFGQRLGSLVRERVEGEKLHVSLLLVEHLSRQ